MNHHMPLTFDGWERIRDYGQQVLDECHWRGDERIMPMHPYFRPQFNDVRHILLEIGLEMDSWLIFARPSQHTQILHSDCAGGERALCALNVPIVGGVGSRMEWFADRPMTMVRAADGYSARYYVPESDGDAEPIETAFFTEGPMLVDVYNPHRVVSGDKARAVVSVRFFRNPSFNQVRRIARQRLPIE